MVGVLRLVLQGVVRIHTEVTEQAPIGCTTLGSLPLPLGQDFPCGGRVEHLDDQIAKEHSHVVGCLFHTVVSLFDSGCSDDEGDDRGSQGAYSYAYSACVEAVDLPNYYCKTSHFVDPLALCNFDDEACPPLGTSAASYTAMLDDAHMDWAGPGNGQFQEGADKEDDLDHQGVGIDFSGLCCSCCKETSSFGDGWM